MIEKFKIAISEEELKKRTHKDYLTTKKMLALDAPEYLALADGDKEALKHLVKAAYILDEIYLKQDNEKNIEFRDFLKSKDDETSKMALRLFLAQKGIHAVDSEANKICLMVGSEETLGKALYPRDLGKEEFHATLISMLKAGKTEKVKEVLNQRSVVVRDGHGLKAIDYTIAFKKEFEKAAIEFEKAAQASTNKDFSEYLILQAHALRENDPMLDAKADKKWAELQDTPLEFTITRENYEDELTGTVVENEELKKLLDENSITAIPKDMLGFRVGIVNKEGTEKLLGIKEYMPALAKEMPFSDQYQQLGGDSQAENNIYPQTMVDVDLVAVTGDVGAWRGGITLAENLPNDDKLSLTIGGGRRNVYHRQIRAVSDWEKLQKRLDETLAKDFHQYYENEADHWFTIGHENAHSLGPKEGGLGKYKSIIEENKADMASLAMVDKLVELGMYTEFQKKQIVLTFAADNFLKAKPNLSQAHRVRSVMQGYYLIQKGALWLNKEGKIEVDIEKMVPVARKMLEEIILIQMSGDFAKAEKFVLDNFIWTDEMETIANKLKEISKTLNGEVEAKLAEQLLAK